LRICFLSVKARNSPPNPNENNNLTGKTRLT
jgi:hypothetical protein